MAIRGPVSIKDETLDYFANEGFFGERGGIVSLATGLAPTGAAWDSNQSKVEYAASPSGRIPIGIMLQNVEDIDLTHQYLNYAQDDVAEGYKLTLVQRGEITTDFINGSPTAGDVGYLSGTGTISPTSGTGAPRVGKFVTGKGANGFAKFRVEL